MHGEMAPGYTTADADQVRASVREQLRARDPKHPLVQRLDAEVASIAEAAH